MQKKVYFGCILSACLLLTVYAFLAAGCGQTIESTTTTTTSTTTTTLAVGSARYCYVNGDPGSHTSAESRFVGTKSVGGLTTNGTVGLTDNWGICYYNFYRSTMEVHLISGNGRYRQMVSDPGIINDFYVTFYNNFNNTIEGWSIDSTTAMAIAHADPFMLTWEASVSGHTMSYSASIKMDLFRGGLSWYLNFVDLSSSPQVLTIVSVDGNTGAIISIVQQTL